MHKLIAQAATVRARSAIINEYWVIVGFSAPRI
jgi:hypothetical protein